MSTEHPAPADDGEEAAGTSRWLIATVNVLVLVAVALLLYLVVPPLTGYFDQDTTKNSCVPPVTKASSSTQPARAGVDALGRVAVRIPSGAPTHFNLGDALDGGQRSIQFTVDRPIPAGGPISVLATRFVSDAGGPDLLGGDITAWSYRGPGSKTGTVVFCIDPETRKTLPSGTFSGGLTLRDPRIETTEIPVSISLKYTNRRAVYIFAFAVCGLASLYVYFLRRPLLGKQRGAAPETTEDTPVLRWKFDFLLGYWRFVTGSMGILTLAAGFTAATAALSAQYLDNPTWDGSDFKDWLTLAGALATAFVAGGTAGRLAQNVYSPSTRVPDGHPEQGMHQDRPRRAAGAGEARPM